MQKKIASLLLALVLCLGLLPVTASAAETNLPDWYFLFAAFKNVDADGKDRDGKAVHVKYSMSQDEINGIHDAAQEFEIYMNSLGVMRAHVEVVEIDETLTELHNDYSGGSFVAYDQATPLLEKKVDLDRYDHVSCIVNLDTLATSYGGITSSEFENGTGHSCINCAAVPRWTKGTYPWSPGYPVHEFLHFMERMNKKWGKEFGLHDIMENFYERVDGEFEACYTDILLNRAKGTAGTGVHPAVWQYPPHVIRSLRETLREAAIPSEITVISNKAFQFFSNLSKVNLHSGVTEIGVAAFEWCTSLTEVTIPSGVTSIGDWAFQGCTALTRATIPDSVTEIGKVAFYHTGLTDVYYAGTEAQWKAIQIGEYNEALTNANIHYGHLMADVKATDWFAQAVMWAMEKGIASGTGEGTFSPNSTCTQGQILTFLWRAYGSPTPSGKVSGNEYYAVPLQWAKEQKLVDESLSAKDPCTRANVVTYLWKLASSPSAKAASFSDVPASASYAGAVNWAVENKITSGTSETTFSPEKTCTRGQIVTFLYQALKDSSTHQTR